MISSRQTDGFIDIFLQPGEFYFGGRETRIRTVLGSCVAITMWHPHLRMGGMCHYMLPRRPCCHAQAAPDGRYAEDAMVLFMQELKKNGSRPSDFDVKMFGGGDQFPGQTKIRSLGVPNNNIRAGRDLLTQYGFTIKTEHLGGTGHRNAIFEVWSGEVWIKHDGLMT